jgi:signal transduction histidine kinase
MLESVLAFLKFDKDVKKAPVTLSVHHPAEANIDANRLKQVIINLIRNSVHALPEKGGKVEIVLGVEKEMALIRVIDNGCGIPDEIMANIWSPFFTTKEDSGMGLGLHISRQIVEQHEGRLECSSKVGKGTVMSVFLPLAK